MGMSHNTPRFRRYVMGCVLFDHIICVLTVWMGAHILTSVIQDKIDSGLAFFQWIHKVSRFREVNNLFEVFLNIHFEKFV